MYFEKGHSIYGIGLKPGFCFILQLLQGLGPVSDPDAFVEVIDGEFVLGCETFPISGINAW